MSRRSSRLLAGVGVVDFVLGALYWLSPESPVAIERDRQKPFRLDPDQPFEINHGTTYLPPGGGDEITIKFGGDVTVRRREPHVPPQKQEEKFMSFKLSHESLGEILRAIDTHRVVELHKSYEQKYTFDGIHKSVTIRQGERVKKVVCKNHFPDEFEAFVTELKAILDPYRAKAAWTAAKPDGW